MSLQSGLVTGMTITVNVFENKFIHYIKMSSSYVYNSDIKKKKILSYGGKNIKKNFEPIRTTLNGK